jgi:peroxiredoxin
MKRFALGLIAATLSASVFAVSPGAQAPDFNLTDVNGKPAKLSDYKGKTVVLEWVNPGCPFVMKHYNARNMQALQKEASGKDVVWLAVNSTNPSHQDYMKPAVLSDWMKKQDATPRLTLMDEKGVAGKAYDARTTPHMYIISPEGRVVYNGAIDDKRSTNPDDVKTSKNFVRVALNESLSGKAVSTASTTPYGCTVKY